jgi:hypothetical protein
MTEALAARYCIFGRDLLDRCVGPLEKQAGMSGTRCELLQSKREGVRSGETALPPIAPK